MRFLVDTAPMAVKEMQMDALFGRKVAIDASMSLYQFLIAVRQDGDVMKNENGEVTSHLLGMFYRTIRMLENGLKPVYVFDGKPPEMKGGELEKRRTKRVEAESALEEAKKSENIDDVNKFTKRLVHVTVQHNDEAKRLLRLMGIPVVEAPCEAEAQCAALCKAGKVYGVGTEDLDALTFGTPILLRHMTASASKKLPIVEIDLSKVLTCLDMSQEQFVDLCILCGCDYTGTIRGIGAQTAFKYIQKYKNIEEVLKRLDSQHKQPSEGEFMYKEAASMFLAPNVQDPSAIELVWNSVDEEGLIQFLVHEKGFALERVQAGIAKLKKSKVKGAQQRMDTFFTAKPRDDSSDNNETLRANNKRRKEENKHKVGKLTNKKVVGVGVKKAKK